MVSHFQNTVRNHASVNLYTIMWQWSRLAEGKCRIDIIKINNTVVRSKQVQFIAVKETDKEKHGFYMTVFNSSNYW